MLASLSNNVVSALKSPNWQATQRLRSNDIAKGITDSFIDLNNEKNIQPILSDRETTIVFGFKSGIFLLLVLLLPPYIV